MSNVAQTLIKESIMSVRMSVKEAQEHIRRTWHELPECVKYNFSFI